MALQEGYNPFLELRSSSWSPNFPRRNLSHFDEVKNSTDIFIIIYS